MKRKLSPWCKEVKKTLIDRDMSVTELCGEVGMCRNYVTIEDLKSTATIPSIAPKFVSSPPLLVSSPRPEDNS